MRKLLRSSTLRARQLRRQATDAERVLWQWLRGRRLDGIKFRRQVPLGPYFADFLSEEARLVVEVDGSHHTPDSRRDRVRDAWLRLAGLRVLRLSMLQDIHTALARIRHAIRDR